MDKSIIRKEFLTKRNLLSEEEVAEKSITIFKNLLKFSIEKYSHFHIFYPISSQNEVDTRLIINHLLDLNKKVYLPKVVNNSMITLEYSKKSELIANRWGVLEPENSTQINEKLIEVVILPLLACDCNGNRVGYGKGFYDKFLPKCRPNVLKIGVSFFEPISDIITVEKTDIPLDYCVTTARIVSFSEISEI